jgi:hypothetical protein
MGDSKQSEDSIVQLYEHTFIPGCEYEVSCHYLDEIPLPNKGPSPFHFITVQLSQIFEPPAKSQSLSESPDKSQNVFMGDS